MTLHLRDPDAQGLRLMRAAKSVKCATTAAPVDAARYPSECMSGSLWFLFQLPSLAKHPRRKNILMMRRRKMRMMTMTMTMAMAMTMRMTMTMRMRMMMMMRMRILKHVVFCLAQNTWDSLQCWSNQSTLKDNKRIIPFNDEPWFAIEWSLKLPFAIAYSPFILN